MVILDTDHLTVLGYEDNPKCSSLAARLKAHSEPVTITVISWEEQVRGWLAEVNRAKSFLAQVSPYTRLMKVVEFFSQWEILPFSPTAANECQHLRKQGIHIGSQDLKIAAIALWNNAFLLSANFRDFRKVPGLRVENWLD